MESMMGKRQMAGDADFAHMENCIERKGMGKGAVGEGFCRLERFVAYIGLIKY